MLILVKNATDPDQKVHTPSPSLKILVEQNLRIYCAHALNFCNQHPQMAATHSISQTQVCQIPYLHGEIQSHPPVSSFWIHISIPNQLAKMFQHYLYKIFCSFSQFILHQHGKCSHFCSEPLHCYVSTK